MIVQIENEIKSVKIYSPCVRSLVNQHRRDFQTEAWKFCNTSLKAKLLSPSGQDQSWEISLRFTGIKTWISSTNRLSRRNENLILTDGSKVFY